MSGQRDRWRCQPDDGTVHLEAAVLPDRLVLCFWRCEEIASAIGATLSELGLSVAFEGQGPCQHEGNHG